MNNPEEIQHFIDVLLKEDSFVKAAKKALHFSTLSHPVNKKNRRPFRNANY